MKSKKLPQRKSADFGTAEKAKKAGAKVPKVKRSKKPSIYDDPDEIENFIFSDQEFGGFNDYDDEDDDYY